MIPTCGNISEGTQSTNPKEHKHSYVHCSIIHNCRDMEEAQVFLNRWVDKTTMGHLQNEILFGYIKEEKFTLCKSMYGSGEYYAKWNKPVSQRKTNTIWFHSYVESKYLPDLTRKMGTGS